MLFGLEQEFFVVNKKGLVVVPRPELHRFLDGGGILVEARGEAQKHPALSLTSLMLQREALKVAVKKAKRTLLLANEADVSPASLQYARREKKEGDFDTPVFERYRNPVVLTHDEPGHYRAGLHIHLSQPDPYDPKRFQPFDMIYPVRLLDQEFAEEIEASGRHPGAYRLKDYGVEYRSLPATIDLKKVVKVLGKLLAPREFEAYADHQIPDDEDDL